jgi:hypothetical protein
MRIVCDIVELVRECIQKDNKMAKFSRWLQNQQYYINVHLYTNRQNQGDERDWFGSRISPAPDGLPPPTYPTSPFELLYLLHLVMYVLNEKVLAYNKTYIPGTDVSVFDS